MINVEKVKVTKEVAEAIEFLRKVLLDDEILEKAPQWNPWVVGAKEDVYRALNTLRGVARMTLAGALINGYEIVEPPDKQVAEYYRNLNELYQKFGYDSDLATMRGIEFVAEAYGLKIEGVDA